MKQSRIFVWVSSTLTGIDTMLLYCVLPRSDDNKDRSSLTIRSLTILSYAEKEGASPSSISKRNTNDVEMKAVDVEFGSSSTGLSLEPPTPIKKL